MHKIAIGCDPNADEMKKSLIQHLHKLGYVPVDFGDSDIIYANTAQRVAMAVATGEFDRGILICGTGIGMSIAANKVRGAYAALLSDCYSAERARLSNNANIACIGAFTVGIELCKRMVDIFLCTEYATGTPSEAKVRKIVEMDSVK